MSEQLICAECKKPITEENPDRVIHLGGKPICQKCLANGTQEIVYKMVLQGASGVVHQDLEQK